MSGTVRPGIGELTGIPHFLKEDHKEKYLRKMMIVEQTRIESVDEVAILCIKRANCIVGKFCGLEKVFLDLMVMMVKADRTVEAMHHLALLLKVLEDFSDENNLSGCVISLYLTCPQSSQ